MAATDNTNDEQFLKLAGQALMDKLAGFEVASSDAKGRVKLRRVLAPTPHEEALRQIMGERLPKREPFAVHPAVVKLGRAARQAKEEQDRRSNAS